MSTILNFHIFRYHLNPITNIEQQTELFLKERLSNKERLERKNEFFEKAIDGLNFYENKVNPLKLEHSENGYFLIKLAQKKSAKIVQDFEKTEVKNEPFVYIIINNDPTVQKIAISENSEAFSEPKVVKNILVKLLNNSLGRHGLVVSIEELFEKESFWNYVNKYRDRLKMIDFKYIRPNLANISKSLPKDFKDFTNNVNSKESHIVLKAPEKGILENIDKSNETINGLVDYTAEGAGEIKLQVKGIRKKYSTSKNSVVIKIDEVQIEGSAEQVIKAYQTLISE